MKRTLGLVLLVTLLALGSSVSAEVIKIGVFEPMTGPSAAGGEMTVEGIELAQELKGEVLGRKVEIIVVDNKSDKVEAANAVSRLMKRKVVATRQLRQLSLYGRRGYCQQSPSTYRWVFANEPPGHLEQPLLLQSLLYRSFPGYCHGQLCGE